MSDSLPIVFLFRNDADYLRYTLSAAHHFNPDNPVILLGTPENAHYRDLGIEHYDYREFSTDAARFEKCYVHRSSLSREFEIFCFQRWLILREFLNRSPYSRALHLDADVMLFSDAVKEGDRFRRHDMTLARLDDDHYRCGHHCYWNNLDTLNAFCEFMFRHFATSRAIAANDRFFDPRSSSHVSDMLMLGLFARERPECTGDISRIEDRKVFDDFFSRPSGFHTESPLIKKNMKKVRFQDGVLWGRHRDHAEPIRFLSIHFHGSLKFLMKYYTPISPQSFFPGVFLERMAQIPRKIIGRKKP